MPAAVSPETPQCSARFVRPFVEVLGDGKKVEDETWTELGLRREDMLPVEQAYHLLASVIDQTQDAQLGLKAASRMALGDVGVVDYLMQTAPTIGEALDVAARYFVLLNESLCCRLELNGDFARFRMESSIPQPPAAEDFMLCSLTAAQAWLRQLEGLEVWFLHPEPSDLAPYKRAFGALQLRFSAPFTGFSLARTHLRQPLPTADRKLHAVVRELADIMLAQQACRSTSFSQRVRSVLAGEVSTQALNAATVARRLQTSGRTLARRLEAEGTSFYTLLDDARRLRALQLMSDTGRTLNEIARATGFAHVASFHRAFRRWTGKTPAEYRHAPLQ